MALPPVAGKSSVVPLFDFCRLHHCLLHDNMEVEGEYYFRRIKHLSFSLFLYSPFIRTSLPPVESECSNAAFSNTDRTKMTFYPHAARRRLLLLTAIASYASNSSTSFVAVAAESDPTGSVGWLPHLNWGELQSKLSPSAALIDTSFNDFRDQCVSEFYVEPVYDLRSTYTLIDQPSGMCLPHLFLGWEADNWMVPGVKSITVPMLISQLSGDPSTPLLKPLDTVMGFEVEGDDTTPSPVAGDESNLRLNLPYKVVFPSNASDVIHIIEFAKKHNIELSVKNSGHSYSGASSKKNTLHINMNQFTHYASGGITECDAAILDTKVADDLSNQACLLALARGKPGVIRVGGGENYGKSLTMRLDYFVSHQDQGSDNLRCEFSSTLQTFTSIQCMSRQGIPSSDS